MTGMMCYTFENMLRGMGEDDGLQVVDDGLQAVDDGLQAVGVDDGSQVVGKDVG